MNKTTKSKIEKNHVIKGSNHKADLGPKSHS